MTFLGQPGLESRQSVQDPDNGREKKSALDKSRDKDKGLMTRKIANNGFFLTSNASTSVGLRLGGTIELDIYSNLRT